ncbi:MAG: hypothetical protein QOK37_1933 [Thermoanaerobaculia bacterium]|jgi:tetratricopeptide (TPR) repeat protein|nr:hypothetical protein [Thermoanaerobaculia bacterium]
MDRPTGDTDEVRELLTQFRRWLDDPESSPGIVRELVALDRDRLAAFVRLHSTDERLFAIAMLIRRAHDALSSAPRDAVTMSRFGTLLCSGDLPGKLQHEIALEGDAWKEHAAALLSAGDYSEADRACIQAASFYGVVAAEERFYERTHLTLIQAQVAHFLGDSERGLQLADRAGATLARFFPTKKRDHLRARTIYATILVASQRYDEGLRALEECAEVARRENDTETLASLVNNIGYVYMQLGNLKAARECLSMALQGFTSLGFKSELPRVHGGLARILTQEGRYNDAVSEHYKARAAYLELNMPVVAGEVTLRIIEALFAAGRLNDIPSLCAEAVETFTRAHLPREAAKALSYINVSARQRTLTADEVQDAREFFQRLQADPDEQFDSMKEEGGD